jgi:hypothetical protein
LDASFLDYRRQREPPQAPASPERPEVVLDRFAAETHIPPRRHNSRAKDSRTITSTTCRCWLNEWLKRRVPARSSPHKVKYCIIATTLCVIYVP